MRINEISENISHTSKRLRDIEREKKVKPGTDEWFKLWFSLPYLKEAKENIYDILEPEDCGPFDGGCVLVAQALQKIHGGDIVVLINDRGNADHAAVKIGNTLLDYDGPLPVDKFVKRFEKNEHVKITGIRPMKDSDLPEATRNQTLLPKIINLLSKGVKEAFSSEPDPTGYQHTALTNPQYTIVVNTPGELDWYKLGQHFANLGHEDPHEYGQAESDMMIVAPNKEQLLRYMQELDRLGAEYKLVGGSHEHPEIHAESNVFTNARMNAIKAGKTEFKVGSKTYKVTGDTKDEKEAVANLSELMNGKVVSINLKHPDSKRATTATSTSFNEDVSVPENVFHMKNRLLKVKQITDTMSNRPLMFRSFVYDAEPIAKIIKKVTNDSARSIKTGSNQKQNEVLEKLGISHPTFAAMANSKYANVSRDSLEDMGVWGMENIFIPMTNEIYYSDAIEDLGMGRKSGGRNIIVQSDFDVDEAVATYKKGWPSANFDNEIIVDTKEYYLLNLRSFLLELTSPEIKDRIKRLKSMYNKSYERRAEENHINDILKDIFKTKITTYRDISNWISNVAVPFVDMLAANRGEPTNNDDYDGDDEWSDYNIDNDDYDDEDELKLDNDDYDDEDELKLDNDDYDDEDELKLESFGSKVNEESGKEMLKIFRGMHHDAGMNKDMDRFILSNDWELRDFTPDMFPSEEEFFDYDDPFDRIIDIDYSHRVNLSAPIIVGPQFSDGKYSVIDGNHRAAAAQRMGNTIKGYFPVKKATEARTFQPQMSPMQDLVAEYQMFSSFGQMGLSDYAKSSDSAEKIKEVIRTLAQSNKNLQNLDKQALEKNKNKILTHIHDMMNYAIAHFREHLKPEQFDAKKQQINKLLTKYNNITSTNENIIREQPDSKNYLLQLERDKRAGMLILHILDKNTGKRTEVRGKMGYETDGYDPNDKLHQLLDKVGKSASVSDLMNGDVVSINPRHPDGASAKAAADKAYNENFADGKNPGRKGLAKRVGVNTKASVSSLRKTAKNSSGEKQRMAHWLANMKAGREK